MTDRDLGRALLDLDAATLAEKTDVAGNTAAILQRDRVRLRLLTWSTIAIWLLALAIICLALIWFGLLFPAQAKLFAETDAGLRPAAELQEIHRTLVVAFHMGTLLIAFSVFITTLAAFLTVLLILAIRRATLRQVNANLVEISHQLRQMQRKAAASQ